MPWKNTFKCKICDRPMPPHIYKFHLKKSHTEEEVQGQVEKNDVELKEILGFAGESNPATVDIIEVEPEMKQKVSGFTKPFDWGEVYPCNTCKEEYPAKAMPFHSWVKHRV